LSTRIILVRHGESQHKVAGVTGGPRSCKGLTETGRQQAARLRDRFASGSRWIPPLHIYTSVLPRAIETAHILAEAIGKTPDAVHQDCGLCSWHIPAEVDGMSVTEFQQQFAVPGGGVFRPFEAVSESWAEMVSRTGRALSGLAQKHQGETTLVVAHAEVVEISLIVFGSLPLARAFDVQVGNTSLTEWITDEDTFAWPPARWTLVRFNDTAHLEAP
jgi:2,3-bisphosphoglycerate-dependent phosphoglycerate mutase